MRVTGAVERVSPKNRTPTSSPARAAAASARGSSQQSSVLPGRAPLEARLAALTAQYGEGEIPLPPFWGGYRVIPASVEFWQGRPSRLHDRLRYSRQPDDSWRIERLSP